MFAVDDDPLHAIYVDRCRSQGFSSHPSTVDNLNSGIGRLKIECFLSGVEGAHQAPDVCLRGASIRGHAMLEPMTVCANLLVDRWRRWGGLTSGQGDHESR